MLCFPARFLFFFFLLYPIGRPPLWCLLTVHRNGISTSFYITAPCSRHSSSVSSRSRIAGIAPWAQFFVSRSEFGITLPPYSDHPIFFSLHSLLARDVTKRSRSTRQQTSMMAVSIQIHSPISCVGTLLVRHNCTADPASMVSDSRFQKLKTSIIMVSIHINIPVSCECTDAACKTRRASCLQQAKSRQGGQRILPWIPSSVLITDTELQVSLFPAWYPRA